MNYDAIIGVRAGSLLIAARRSLVKGIRLNLFHSRFDGVFNFKGKQKKGVTRIMVVTCKMRYWKSRGGGADADGDDTSNELVVGNVHLHHRMAKKAVQNGGRKYKDVC